MKFYDQFECVKYSQRIYEQYSILLSKFETENPTEFTEVSESFKDWIPEE